MSDETKASKMNDRNFVYVSFSKLGEHNAPTPCRNVYILNPAVTHKATRQTTVNRGSVILSTYTLGGLYSY